METQEAVCQVLLSATCVSFSACGRVVVTSSAMSRTVQVLTWRTSTVARKLSAPGTVNQSGVSRDGWRVAAACEDADAVVWQRDEQGQYKVVARLHCGGRQRATGVAISGDGTMVAAAYGGGGGGLRGGEVMLYHVRQTGAAARIRSIPHDAICGRVVLAEDGDVVAWASANGVHVHAFDSRSTSSWLLRGVLPPALAMSRDARKLVAASVDANRTHLRIWDGDGFGAFRRAPRGTIASSKGGGAPFAAAGGRGDSMVGTLGGAVRLSVGGVRQPSPGAHLEIVDAAMHTTAYVTLLAAACRDGVLRVWRFGSPEEDEWSAEDDGESMSETDSSISDSSEYEFESERQGNRWR